MALSRGLLSAARSRVTPLESYPGNKTLRCRAVRPQRIHVCRRVSDCTRRPRPADVPGEAAWVEVVAPIEHQSVPPGALLRAEDPIMLAVARQNDPGARGTSAIRVSSASTTSTGDSAPPRYAASSSRAERAQSSAAVSRSRTDLVCRASARGPPAARRARGTSPGRLRGGGRSRSHR